MLLDAPLTFTCIDMDSSCGDVQHLVDSPTMGCAGQYPFCSTNIQHQLKNAANYGAEGTYKGVT